MGKNLKLNTKKKKELIRFVKINPTLWNKTNPGYHNYAEKEKAWVAIGRALKIKTSGDDIKVQFRNLRDRFAKEYKKQIRSQPSSSGAGRASTGEIYVSQWEFFQELSFLRDQIAPRPTTSNMASPDMSTESPNNEKKSEVKSDMPKLGDESVNRLPSWFQTPETDDFSNSEDEKKGNRKRKLEKRGEDSASSDEDINSDSESDASDSEHDRKQEKKVPDFDGFAKKRRASDTFLTDQMARMTRMTTKVIKQLGTAQATPLSSPPASDEKALDSDIQPMLEMIKWALNSLPTKSRVECAAEIMQLVVKFFKEN